MSGNQLVSPVYQQALYYPYVHFRDPHWLKVTALYWDGILRMKPPFMEKEDLERRDDPLVQELKRGDPNFIRSVDLYQDSSSIWASQRLVDMIKDAEAHPDSQSLYQTAMRPHTSDELNYPIALSGGLDDFYRQFVDRHLARFDDDKMMFYFEPTLGQIFMALLATHVASKYGVSVISHEAVYQDLLRAEFLSGKVPIPEELPPSEQLSSEVLHGPVQERLVTMAFEGAVPDPKHLDDLSVDKILAFRRDHADGRRAFFNFIRKMADDLSHDIDVTDSNVLQDRLRVYEPQFKEETQKLRNRLKATGIDAISQTLSIDGKIPLLGFLTGAGGTTLSAVGLVTAPLVPVLAAVTAVGSLAVGLFQVSVNWRRKRTTEREKSPYSYLLDLNEVTHPQSLLQRQVDHLSKFIRGS